MNEYEPIRDDGSVFGWLCGYCCYTIAFSQKYCDECGHKVKWDGKDESEKQEVMQ